MPTGIREGMGIASLVLLAASIVLMFFVVLSGLNSTTPLDKTYFLRADTSSIPGARPISQWTYFYICGDGNTDCGAPVPALPFGYAWINGTEGVPAELVGSFGKNTTSKYYWYIWRFGWVFYLLGLIFNVLSFLAAILAPCSRLASGFGGLITGFALFFFSVGAALMTTEFVKARDVLRSAGIPATIGRYALGFTWGAWAAMFLAAVMLFLGCGLSGSRSNDNVTSASSSRGFFRRQRSRKSARGSFVDGDASSARRVKDDYA